MAVLQHARLDDGLPDRPIAAVGQDARRTGQAQLAPDAPAPGFDVVLDVEGEPDQAWPGSPPFRLTAVASQPSP